MLLCMRTSIDIPNPLFRKAKRFALDNNTTLKALVEEGLRGVVDRKVKDKKRTNAEYRDFSVGGQGLQPGVDLRNWEQIRAIIYEGRGG